MTKSPTPPSLKSASGAGFTFEDKVAAFLLCEMLAGRGSLGGRFGVIEKLERQAVDWEPFGDLRLTVSNNAGKFIRCGASVKSNRQVSSNGCTSDLCAGLWATQGKTVFIQGEDLLAIFCSTLAQDVHQHLHSLCNQAAESDPVRLDQKVIHAEVRKIYDSFCNPNDKSEAGLPGHILGHLVPREFDFEDNTSRDEAAAVSLCRDVLAPDASSDQSGASLWNELLLIAQTLRIAGGEVTRAKLAAKLRIKFILRNDPFDAPAWSRIRDFSKVWLNEIDTTLPGGLAIPRVDELQNLRANIAKGRALPVLGETGSGKSASVKIVGTELEQKGAEVVWIKSERFVELLNSVPNFIEVCRRTRNNSGVLVFDALEGCYGVETYKLIAQTINELTSSEETPWQIVLICQTPEWSRVAISLTRHLATSSVLNRHLEFAELSKKDFVLVCATHPSVARLSSQVHIRRVLAMPKMLDILLGGQLAENRLLASEADLVDWWWEQQVRGVNTIAGEERVARQLAARMADELCTELPPDVVTGSEAPTDVLVRNRVLRLTRDGRIRFHHDLLADWSRMKHLLSLGDEAVAFMVAHAENPPWLRSVRLMSQHLLDRVADFNRWRNILKECNPTTKDGDKPTAENLQVLDAWLEGIVFCSSTGEVLKRLKPELFQENGMQLQRLVRRLLHVGTFPDPVIQEQWRERDPKAAEAVASQFRLPQQSLWLPVLQFLVNNSDEATDYLPEELADIGIMWARYEEYLQRSWPVLADLVLQNAEKELSREVAGVYRSDRESRTLFGWDDSRIAIYAAGLHAGAQLPERAAKLTLKAAGRLPWDEGDLSAKADIEWKGKIHEYRAPIFVRPRYTGPSPTSWEQGPCRRTSNDFANAWLQYGAALGVFKKCPEMSCEATLGFLLRWPKFQMSRDSFQDIGSENHGFSSAADDMSGPFWTKGPFLGFLRENWKPALDMIVQLINFATDRYCDWWPYEPVSELKFTTPVEEVCWKGNHQVYAWNRYNMNVVDAVSCALMALEKWLDDCITSGQPVSVPIQTIFKQGRSMAFAGVFISLGKRHTKLFVNELKPMLFVRELYMLDLHASMDSGVGDFWSQDSKMIKELRREWANLPGRKTRLLDDCCEWYLTKPECSPVLEEVAAKWRETANGYAAGSQEQLVLLRWASNFDRSCWTETVTADGRKVWRPNRPEELRDLDAEKEQSRRQWLMTIPMQCVDALAKRHRISDEQLDSLWKTISNWSQFEAKPTDQEDEFSSMFLDHRHARAGLLAVFLSLGRDWLKKHPKEHESIKDEVRKLLANPPKIFVHVPEDLHDDGEGFLARCAVQCLGDDPKNEEWRAAVARFVMAYRYRTVQVLFEEVYHTRQALGSAVQNLQAFALAYAVIRKKVRSLCCGDGQADTKLTDEWATKWIPAFAADTGPNWPATWKTIELADEFPVEHSEAPGNRNRRRQVRRNYGFDVQLLIATFANLPKLTDAADHAERARWLNIAKELLGTLLRTLPPSPKDCDEEWEYQHWKTDEQIFDAVARRLFECSQKEQAELWQPALDLPPSAHHHITGFLNAVLLQSVETDPPRVLELLQTWKEIIEFLFSKPEWMSRSRGCEEVWQHLFLYGTPFTAFGEEIFIPFIDGLRMLFQRHVTTRLDDAYDQSRYFSFITTKAGERLLVDSFSWLLPSWERANHWFWGKAAERSNFAHLLEYAWRGHFLEIKKHTDSLKAFKILTLNLAARQIPIALEIQGLIGTTP